MSCELEAGNIIKDLQGREYKIIRRLSEGAQGRIYEVDNNRIAKVNYVKSDNRDKILKQLNWIMKQTIPDEARIAKPLAILENPYTGYIMQKVPEDYEPLSKYIKINSNYSFSEWFNDVTGGLKKRLQIGILIAKSLRSIHFEGLTYCDLSPNNILVSPTKNSIAIIDADNLTATGVFLADILGTPGYIAPELFSDSRQPNSLSDAYSFAVLLFEMLCLGHPLVGDSIIEDTPEVEEDAMKGNAVYVNHPEDDSNRNSRVSKLMIFLTEKLKELFNQSFNEGLHNPISRPSLKDYIDVLEEAFDQVIVCKNPECGGSYLYNNEKKVKCPFCKREEDNVDHLKFRRKTHVKGFELIDSDNIGQMKNFKTIFDETHIVVINKEVTYLRKRHFDTHLHANVDDKVLKIIKLGTKTYKVISLDKSLTLYIANKKNGKMLLMTVGQEYDFLYDETAILLKSNSNLIDGSPLEMDCFGTRIKPTTEGNISVLEYVAIYY